MNSDLSAALGKLGLSGLDKPVIDRLETIITRRVDARVELLRQREVVKARAEQMHPATLVGTLTEALLPEPTRRGRKPGAKVVDAPASTVSAGAAAGSNVPAQPGVSGVQDE